MRDSNTSTFVRSSENAPEHGAYFLTSDGEVAALMHQHDWSNSPLGNPDTWPEALCVLTGVILASKQPMYLLWGADQIMLYNDAYIPVLAGRHPASIGQSIRDIWADIWPDISDLINRACEGQACYLDEFELVLNRNGREQIANFKFSYTPIHNKSGGVDGMLCACEETTDIVLARQRRGTARQHLITMFKHAPNFFAMLTGPQYVIEVANDAALRLIGNKDVIGQTFAAALPNAVAQGFGDLLETVRKTGVEHIASGAKYTKQSMTDGVADVNYIDFVLQPVLDEAGGVTGIVVSGSDVTVRVVALNDLTKSEKFLKNILESSKDCIKVLDLQGNLIFMNESGKAVMEVSDFDALKGSPWCDFWQGPHNKDATDAIAEALAGKIGSFQGEANTMQGNPRYWDVRVTAITDELGQPINLLAVSRDISHLREIDRQRDALMHEMAHRMKNVLTITQAIVSQSMRHAVSLEDARKAIQGRITALSSAQDILTNSNTTTADIHDIVSTALRPHIATASRVSFSGPAIQLEGQKILGLALAVHELATNAVKYGALSNDDGTVTLTWAGSGDTFQSFEWVERGGPGVAPPTRQGFGTKLIQTLVGSYFGGVVDLTYLPEGVTFSLKHAPAA